jgi:hypothetical protein
MLSASSAFYILSSLLITVLNGEGWLYFKQDMCYAATEARG